MNIIVDRRRRPNRCEVSHWLITGVDLGSVTKGDPQLCGAWVGSPSVISKALIFFITKGDIESELSSLGGKALNQDAKHILRKVLFFLVQTDYCFFGACPFRFFGSHLTFG